MYAGFSMYTHIFIHTHVHTPQSLLKHLPHIVTIDVATGGDMRTHATCNELREVGDAIAVDLAVRHDDTFVR
jgi:hypothetical protein